MNVATDIILTPKQEEAVDMIASESVCVLTGLPGSGKTTTLSSALARVQAQKDSFALAAPTGKAARRMTEATGHPASTVHRLLGYHPQEGFRVNAASPLTMRQIVIDEASMLDTELAAAILVATRPNRTRLCFTGDAYQLPSVGPGRILGDMIDSGVIPCVELTEVHRAAAESWICRSAPMIKAGVKPDVTDVKDFSFWREASLEAVETAVLEAVSGIQTTHGVRPCVITPRRQGVMGSATTLNPRLQDLLNPHGMPTQIKNGDGLIVRLGDYVIQRSNNYELGVFNGDCGTVTNVHKRRTYEGEQLFLEIEFEGQQQPIFVSRKDALLTRLAYALTAHSTQGSQFPWIIVVCHSGHWSMLNRQILYTMITRAQKGVIMIGDDRGLARALSVDAPSGRKTGLIQRLRGEL